MGLFPYRFAMDWQFTAQAWSYGCCSEVQYLLQVVVLAGGTNDFHILPPPALEDFISAYMNLIMTVSCHGLCLIMCPQCYMFRKLNHVMLCQLACHTIMLCLLCVLLC